MTGTPSSAATCGVEIVQQDAEHRAAGVAQVLAGFEQRLQVLQRGASSPGRTRRAAAFPVLAFAQPAVYQAHGGASALGLQVHVDLGARRARCGPAR